MTLSRTGRPVGATAGLEGATVDLYWLPLGGGYLVFATDPERTPDERGYRHVFATEAKTPGEATAKVRPLAADRRLRTYLATGHYRGELADARWVA